MRALKTGFPAAIFGVCGLHAAASTIHHVRFAQPATVVVWEDGALLGQGREITLIDGGSLADRDYPGSGLLLSSRDRPDSKLVISIASNTGFVIHAAAGQDADRISVRLVETGANAVAAPLLQSSEGEIVYRQDQKTAHRPGSPLSQTITLDLSWDGPPPQLTIAAY